MAEFRDQINYLLFLSSYIPLGLIIAIRVHSKGPLTGISKTYNFPIQISWASVGILGFSLVLLLILYFVIEKVKSRGSEIKKIKKVRQRNELLASYLLVYVFAFSGLTFVQLSDIAIFLIFFGLLFAIQIQSESLYINPLLAIWGYRIYEATFEGRVVLVISEIKLEERLKPTEWSEPSHEEVELIPMGSNTYILPADG